MDHTFQPIYDNPTKCARCSYAELDHSDTATCEECGNTSRVDEWCGMLMCAECINKDKMALAEHQAPEKQEQRLSLSAQLERAKHEIIERADVFNADIPSLVAIQDAIDIDDTIPPEQKTFKKAEATLELFNHLKNVIFEINQTRDRAINVQRAAQQDLNQFASKLRIEEREKLKLSDLNYKPVSPKLSKPKAVRKPKFDKAEIKKYALELGVPEYNLQTMVIRRGCTVEEAAKILKEMLGV